ncbi:hypothetical protein QFC20_004719 [Naganishia adeliensis]|uniref:Uncharacterized protein n=1 Tax=Naganishia adeliensis TaxID=92952 RepID=A0ACC2VXA0_9TREE|nr:hypothetical protein QFC20_004719 [Naganishia adeliensis]
MSSTSSTPVPSPSAATSGNGASVPPQVVTIGKYPSTNPRTVYSPSFLDSSGLAFIATAFFVVVLGFFLRMYVARRRFEAEGQPAPSWLDVFFSIVESRHARGRTAASGFLYFEPGFGRSRMPWGTDKGPADGLSIPTLYDCDVELGSEQEDMQITSMQLQPMTVYDKFPSPTDPTALLPGNQLGISLLIQMPTAPEQPRIDEDGEPILPEISIGVMDLWTVQDETRESVDQRRPEERKASSKADKAGQEVQHLEYRG